jgi:hypothetical protein
MWMISLNAKRNPYRLLAVVLTGIVARLGTIVAFVLSIKAAIWIFQPESIPKEFYQYIPVSQNVMLGILILIPGIVFTTIAIIRYFHSLNSFELQVVTSDHLTKKLSLDDFEKTPEELLSDNKTFSKIASKLKTNHAKLFAVQIMMINLMVLVPVILISLLIGMIINWAIVISVLGLGIVLIIVFIWSKHQERNELENASAGLQTEKSNSVQSFIKLHSEPKINTENVTLKSVAITESIYKLKYIDEKFKLNSDLSIDIGQSIIVIFFLYLLLNADIQSMKTEYLVILALLFRFIISYGKAIVQAIVKLNAMYSFIVYVKEVANK